VIEAAVPTAPTFGGCVNWRCGVRQALIDAANLAMVRDDS
jgi:hypothetical protein